MSEGSIIEKHNQAPITQGQIAGDLVALGLEPGVVVIVHSSLSALGWVSGGAVAVIGALQSVLHNYGTLIMPTHSGDLSDPQLWDSPPVPKSWWPTIRETMPAFAPELTPTRAMGKVPELFRTFPDVLRSNHPQVSFAGWGERAVEILSDHSLEFSLGERSPLARVYDADGHVLLLGVGFESNTSIHLAEYRADYPAKERVTLGAPVVVDGHRRWKNFTDINYNSDDFAEIGKAFVKSHKQSVRIGRVGEAPATLMPQRELVDFAVKWMHTHRR